MKKILALLLTLVLVFAIGTMAVSAATASPEVDPDRCRPSGRSSRAARDTPH